MADNMSFLKAIDKSNEKIAFKNKSGNISSFVPIEWFYSEEIPRKVFEKALREMLERKIKEKRGLKALQNYRDKAGKFSTIKGFYLMQDKEGHAYLKVKAEDEYTQMYIYQDDKSIDTYRTDGFGVTESELLDEIKAIKLKERASRIEVADKSIKGIPNRIISDLIKNLPSENAMEGAAESLVDYVRYIKEMSKIESTMICDVAEENIGMIRNPRKNKQPVERINDIILSNERYSYLESLQPESIININPQNSNDPQNKDLKYQFKAFVYDLECRDETENGKMIIIEPENGKGYTRTVYVNKEELTTVRQKLEANKKEGTTIKIQDVYEEIVARTLSKTRTEIVDDKNILLTNHTTADAFKGTMGYFVTKNIDVLGNKNSSFYRRMDQREKLIRGERE